MPSFTVKGDSDGDPIYDVAVYRLGTNTFFYRSTRIGNPLERQWAVIKGYSTTGGHELTAAITGVLSS